MSAKADAFRIFIFCDDPSHRDRTVAVTNFLHARGTWTEEPASRASTDRVGTGTSIVGDTLPAPGWALDPEISNSEIRSRFELTCRKCRRRPVPARSERLFTVLDGLRVSGVTKVSLAVVAAMLGEQTGRN